jgi:hypothetical protein
LAGYDEVPDFNVNKCMRLLKKNPHIAHIYNASLELDIFCDRLKTATVTPLCK